jgi:hypothetical protein
VEVRYQQGRDAVLTVFDESGGERGAVVLSDLATKEEMHRAMVEMGFRRKSDEEIGRIQAERFWLGEEEKRETIQRNEEVIARHVARLEERKRREAEEAADAARRAEFEENRRRVEKVIERSRRRELGLELEARDDDAPARDEL